jgi:phosphoribosylanthranilate isomerase
MWVKICGITSEEDALLAVAMGTDAVGFIFAPSPRQMSPSAVQAITRRLPPEILTVGVFRDELPRTVVDVVNRAGLKAAQLHGNESVEECNWIAERIPLVIKAFAGGDPRLARAGDYAADVILVDSPSPGSGKVFDWKLAEGAPESRRIVLAGGLDAANVADAVRTVHPWGVDAATGVETSPGKKDAGKVRAFIQAARAAEPEPYQPADAGEPGPFDWQEETNL